MSEIEINTPRKAADKSEQFHDELDPNDRTIVFEDTDDETGKITKADTRGDLQEEIQRLQYELERLDLLAGRLEELATEANHEDPFGLKISNLLDSFDRNNVAERSLGLQYDDLKDLVLDEVKISELFEVLRSKLDSRKAVVAGRLKENQIFSDGVENYIEEKRLPEAKAFVNENLDLLKKAAFAEAMLDGKVISLSPEDESIVLARRAAEKIISKE